MMLSFDDMWMGPFWVLTLSVGLAPHYMAHKEVVCMCFDYQEWLLILSSEYQKQMNCWYCECLFHF